MTQEEALREAVADALRVTGKCCDVPGCEVYRIADAVIPLIAREVIERCANAALDTEPQVYDRQDGDIDVAATLCVAAINIRALLAEYTPKTEESPR